MKLLLIRHGDPDYEKDSLTERGRQEALFLAERIARLVVDQCFVSPCGRAKETAKPTLERLNMTAQEYDWLREFDVRRILRPDCPDKRSIPWDWLPQDWLAEEVFFDKDRWASQEVMAEAGVGEYYDAVTRQFDELMASFGYQRENKYYHVEESNQKTLVFFCHLGVQCVILSHLMNVSPMPLWHGISMPPSSVTTLVTEERRKGTAVFRALSIGDISHLYAHDMSLLPSHDLPFPSAHFCECFDLKEERHG
ncbi:MAG: histidine phosphatase family protein [Blautia sp.]|nr:histidine phosphatase family protein [Blautia sp.]